jgi:hypothetical protein
MKIDELGDRPFPVAMVDIPTGRTPTVRTVLGESKNDQTYGVEAAGVGLRGAKNPATTAPSSLPL